MKTSYSRQLKFWGLLIGFLGFCLFTSCSSKKSNPEENNAIESQLEYHPQTTEPKEKEKTFLCKINGVDWYYNEVRCRKILSTDFAPREKYVLNFRNNNSQAGENITLMYNANTKELEYVDAAIQDPDSEPGVRQFFGFSGYTEKELAQIRDVGVLTDVSGGNVSGMASFTIAKNSKGVFKNEFDEAISVTDFTFANIPYEDETEN